MTLRYSRFRISDRPFIYLIRLLLLVLMLGNIAGCDRSDQGATAPPAALQEELALANARIQELSRKYDHIKSENERLKGSPETENKLDRESDDRIRQLIAGYGPGIWDQRENNIYPCVYQKREGQEYFRNDSGAEYVFISSRLPRHYVQKVGWNDCHNRRG